MKDISKVAGVASLIALVIAGANLYGYWQAFGINPFPSLSFQQLVAMSTIPLFQTLGWGTIYQLAFQAYTHSPAYERELQSMQANQRLLKMRLCLAFFLLITLIYTGLSLWRDWPTWWFGGALWIPFLYVEASRRGLVIPVPVKSRLEFTVLYFVFASFVSAYASGISEAHNLRDPVSPNNAKIEIADKEERVKLVGRLGDQFYVFSPDKSISMIPASNVSRIRFLPGLRIRP
jgi:hypothetical protein